MTNVVYEVKKNTGILLNANESYQNIDQEMLDQFKQALDTIEFQRYPEDAAIALRKAYAAYAGVQYENVMCGNGSDELLGFIIALCLKGGKKLYTLDPDFSMYDYYTSMANGKMVKYPYQPKDTFHVQAFIEYGRRKNIDMVLFSNPNNPTGQMISCGEILQILDAFPCIPVVIDEAYVDFSDENMVPYLNKYNNLILLRTMSKAFGMASIRCGFMLANTSTMSKIFPFKVPYNVNSITQAFACIALSNTTRAKTYVEEIKKARDDLYNEIQSLHLKNFTLYPSKANYLYGTSTTKHQFLSALEKQDVHIRNYKDDDAIRITIGCYEENKKILKIIKEVYGKE